MDRDVSALCESTMTQGAEETVLSDTPGGVDSVEPRVVLVGEAANDQELVIALEAMGLPLVTCETGEDAGTSANPEQETVVIVAEFSGPEYERLLPTDCRILGPAVLLRAARRKEPLPYCLRPLFCTAMSSLVLCFTGFRSKDELVKLVTLVHHMGGSIRKDFSSKVTHLVANGTHGDKYRVAVSMGIPIMREEWIHKAWDRRLEPEGSATDEPLLALKMPPFHGCSLSFLGFSEEDQTQMRELARMQGGECVEVGDERSSHLVVEENMVKVLPPEIPFKTYIVKQEWFWGSIQMEARAEESIYTFEMTESPSLKTCVSQMTLGTPVSGQKRRRRREATLAQLARSADHGASPLVPPCKRKSTDTSLGSLLNISNTPDTPMLGLSGSPGPVAEDRSWQEGVGGRRCSLRPLGGKRNPWATPVGGKRARGRRGSAGTSEKFARRAASRRRVAGSAGSALGRGVAGSVEEGGDARKARVEREVVEGGVEAAWTGHGDTLSIAGRAWIEESLGEASGSWQGGSERGRQGGRPRGRIGEASCRRESRGQQGLKDAVAWPSPLPVVDVWHGSAAVPLCSSTPKMLVAASDGPWPRPTEDRPWGRGSVPDIPEGPADLVEEEGSSVERQGGPRGGSGGQLLEEKEGMEAFVSSATLRPGAEAVGQRPRGDSARRGNGMGGSSTPLPPPKPSARWQVAMELLQTESNYVDILTNIIELFKEPLERVAQPGGPILPAEEIKAIFSSIPDILDVHTRMKADLEQSMIEWTDNTSIGDIILRYSRDMVKAYPPFVNFFEMSKETIGNCEKQNPRFHAFLKINQAKPQCGRQSLKELLIRPVQRLPSVGLLLNDIMKHTSEGSADKRSLRNAIEALKEVMTHINEDKRKTEGQRLIFDIVYEVEGCPANLLSSHRTLVAREEVTALDDELCDRGETISMFLFTDCLEIARKRGKAKGGFKSPHSTHARPSLKHVLLMPLSQVKKVMDIYETDECSNAFGLVVRPPTENEDHLFTFQLLAEVGTSRKAEWLKTLSRQVANTICKPDAESLIYPINPVAIDVSTRAVDSTLSRASRAIKKTSKKVTRAFSFSKTPKQAAQRARAGSPPQSGDGGRSPGGFEGHKDWSMGRRHTSSLTLAAMRSPSLVSLPALMEKPRHHTISQSTARLL
ncbi:protein ECT2 isoform X1 [Lethenteron reissneri]|uniref:protein ECT2 isoform X1 n=1 Tax=Lethenteron reissneri TaxID=7753 RepID=UPI002AB63562|nr:protein ECT2 isoform X1 [Lethenteron reissneri]